MRKWWCHDNKTWPWDNWKRARVMVRWVVLHDASYIRRTVSLENAQGSLQFGMPCTNSDTQGKFCDGLGNNIVVQYTVGPIITLHGRIIAREHVDRLGNQANFIIKNLFQNNDAFSQDDNVAIHTAGTVRSLMVWRAWRWTSISLASTITRFEHHWIILVSLMTTLRNRFPLPISLEELEDINKEWYKIPRETVQNM
jgi:hypothetical protein